MRAKEPNNAVVGNCATRLALIPGAVFSLSSLLIRCPHTSCAVVLPISSVWSADRGLVANKGLSLAPLVGGFKRYLLQAYSGGYESPFIGVLDSRGLQKTRDRKCGHNCDVHEEGGGGRPSGSVTIPMVCGLG